jgi:hypothetical protein
MFINKLTKLELTHFEAGLTILELLRGAGIKFLIHYTFGQDKAQNDLSLNYRTREEEGKLWLSVNIDLKHVIVTLGFGNPHSPLDFCFKLHENGKLKEIDINNDGLPEYSDAFAAWDEIGRHIRNLPVSRGKFEFNRPESEYVQLLLDIAKYYLALDSGEVEVPVWPEYQDS